VKSFNALIAARYTRCLAELIEPLLRRCIRRRRSYNDAIPREVGFRQQRGSP
jgi:hypothetical protein